MRGIFPKSVQGTIAAHWRGKFGLLVTIVGALIGLRLLMALPNEWVRSGGYFPLMLLWIAISLAVAIWQVIGALRSIDRHIGSTGDMGLAWAGYGAILATLVLTGLQTIDVTVSLFPPKPNAVSASLSKLPVKDDGKTLHIDGDISYQTSTAFKITLQENTKIERVVFSSDGGHIYASRLLAKRIEEAGLSTDVVGHCYSACTIAFMGGRMRSLQEGARLGFHQYEMMSKFHIQTVDFAEEQKKDQAFFLSRGASPDFVKRMYQASHTEIWTPERDVLLRAGILTQ